jgi:hypothetical protein
MSFLEQCITDLKSAKAIIKIIKRLDPEVCNVVVSQEVFYQISEEVGQMFRRIPIMGNYSTKYGTTVITDTGLRYMGVDIFVQNEATNAAP